MKRNFFKYISLIIILVSCSTSQQNYRKYDSLNFIYKNFMGDELNSFENAYYYLFKGEFIAYDVNIGTVDKIKLLDKLDEINFFDIADSLKFNKNSRTRFSKLYIQHFGYEKEIKWNSESIRNSIYKSEIEELVSILNEIKKDNLRDAEFPIRGAIW